MDSLWILDRRGALHFGLEEAQPPPHRPAGQPPVFSGHGSSHRHGPRTNGIWHGTDHQLEPDLAAHGREGLDRSGAGVQSQDHFHARAGGVVQRLRRRASALVASAECWKFVEASELALPDPFTKTIAFGAAGFSAIIGWCTLTGSLLAVLKLLGGVSIFGKWWAAPTWGPAWLNVVKVLLVALVVVLTVALVNDPRDARWPILLLASSGVLGVLLVLPIGGADMPVVVSLLNSLSGITAAFTGFIINNPLLLVAGSLVGASGFILTIVMCKAMNRTLTGVLFQPYTAHASEKLTRTKVGSDPEEVAMVLDGARKVIIVPGYGMAVSQSQHVVKEFAELLAQKYDTEVKYAIHPVAGRMPGHMNVLLAEANVAYEQMVEMDDINPEFPECDVALVIGANDTCNPAAREETGPLAGMPIINVDQAQHVVVVKRSLGVGYAGVDNDVFYMDKTMMLFEDAKTMMGQLNKALAEG